MKKRNCIAIIPARGGSKRIKRKNIKDFFGQPMIGYAIKNAIKSKLFDKIIVSTDDLKIKKIAEKYGSLVPFIRPKNISNDSAGILKVMSHAVKMILPKYKNVFGICCIFPTTPLLTPADLVTSFNIFKGKKWNYVFGAKEFSHPPERGFTLNDKKGLEMLSSISVNKGEKTQDFKKSYHDAGQFYWAKPSTWIKEKKVFLNYSTIYLQPESNFIDIDNIEDWNRAKIMYAQKYKLKLQ